MTIADSHMRVNADTHVYCAEARISRDPADAYGEHENARQSIVPRVAFHEPDAVFRSETVFASAFTAQVLVQALAVGRATPLEAARVYGTQRCAQRKRYLFA